MDPGAQLALQRAPRGAADLGDLGAPLADQDPLLGLRLGPDLGSHRDQAVLARGDLADETSTECGISWRVRFRTCSRISSASSSSLDWSLRSSGGYR